jgi:hypothetical protein
MSTCSIYKHISIKKSMRKPPMRRTTVQTLPHVWCPKTPDDFAPELRGLFFKVLNRRTLSEMLEMKRRNIAGMEPKFYSDLAECMDFVRAALRASASANAACAVDKRCNNERRTC